MSTFAPGVTVEILDGTLQEVRERLNSLPEENRRVRAVVWQEAPGPATVTVEPHERAAIAYLEERMRHPLTDPVEIAQAEAERRELLLRLYQNRIEAGELSTLPDELLSPETA